VVAIAAYEATLQSGLDFVKGCLGRSTQRLTLIQRCDETCCLECGRVV